MTPTLPRDPLRRAENVWSMHSRDLIVYKLLLKIVKGHFARKRVADAVDHSQLRATLLDRNREPFYTGMWELKYVMSAQAGTSRDGPLVACRSKV